MKGTDVREVFQTCKELEDSVENMAIEADDGEDLESVYSGCEWLPSSQGTNMELTRVAQVFTETAASRVDPLGVMMVLTQPVPTNKYSEELGGELEPGNLSPN